jgi:hypothetical protein
MKISMMSSRKLINLSKSDSQKDLKSYYAFDELDGMEDEEEVRNVGSEYEARWDL